MTKPGPKPRPRKATASVEIRCTPVERAEIHCASIVSGKRSKVGSAAISAAFWLSPFAAVIALLELIGIPWTWSALARCVAGMLVLSFLLCFPMLMAARDQQRRPK